MVSLPGGEGRMGESQGRQGGEPPKARWVWQKLSFQPNVFSGAAARFASASLDVLLVGAGQVPATLAVSTPSTLDVARTYQAGADAASSVLDSIGQGAREGSRRAALTICGEFPNAPGFEEALAQKTDELEAEYQEILTRHRRGGAGAQAEEGHGLAEEVGEGKDDTPGEPAALGLGEKEADRRGKEADGLGEKETDELSATEAVDWKEPEKGADDWRAGEEKADDREGSEKETDRQEENGQQAPRDVEESPVLQALGLLDGALQGSTCSQGDRARLLTSEEFHAALMLGAHFVKQDEGNLYNALGRVSGMKKRGSSHYKKQKAPQFGMDLPEGLGHLLVGLTTDGNSFFQLESHGLGNASKAFSDSAGEFVGHMRAYGQHAYGHESYVQIGPGGCIAASEKDGQHVTLS
jgi:hypothetical protein